MSHWRISLTFTLGILTIGAALLLARPVNALATDTIDPATQPHLKSWSNIIPTAKRFVVLADFNNDAVLDRETGLVWERSPDTGRHTWGPTEISFDTNSATWFCAAKNVGGRKGWRLPSIPELASLIDPTVAYPGPMLPVGHPFTNVANNDPYWSATTSSDFTTHAWNVRFDSGRVDDDVKTNPDYAWCIRGPMNASAY